MHAPSKSIASLASHFAGLVVVSGLWPEFRRLSGNCSRHNFDATGFFSHFPPFLTLFRENPAFLSTKLTFLRELKRFYFELKRFYFELKRFYFELKPFYFELKPFYFELKPFYLELKSFLLGQISFFLGQFRQKTAFFSGPLPEIRVMCAFACS